MRIFLIDFCPLWQGRPKVYLRSAGRWQISYRAELRSPLVQLVYAEWAPRGSLPGGQDLLDTFWVRRVPGPTVLFFILVVVSSACE